MKFVALLILIVGLIIAGIAVTNAFAVINRIVISDQDLGESVFVKELSLARGGFIVITSATRLEDPYNELAVSAYFPAGKYKDIRFSFRNVYTDDPTKLELHRGQYHIASVMENLNSDKKNIEGLPSYHIQSTRRLEKPLDGFVEKTFLIR